MKTQQTAIEPLPASDLFGQCPRWHLRAMIKDAVEAAEWDVLCSEAYDMPDKLPKERRKLKSVLKVKAWFDSLPNL